MNKVLTKTSHPKNFTPKTAIASQISIQNPKRPSPLKVTIIPEYTSLPTGRPEGSEALSCCMLFLTVKRELGEGFGTFDLKLINRGPCFGV